MQQTTISIEDFQPTLAAHRGNLMWKRALENIKTSQELLCLLAAYIEFNSVFATGVIGLAAAISAGRNLFREAGTVPFLTDRSNEVASRVFRAAVDEFGVPSHRTLAQGTLLCAAGFFNSVAPETRIPKTIQQVLQGYGYGRPLEDFDLFLAMGFHFGSERLADNEFRILDCYLQRHHPGLVEYLQENTANVCGHDIPGYLWVGVHTLVEAEHRDAALQAAQLGLKWYSGNAEQAKASVLEGFASFGRLQTNFMASLIDGTKFG